jgi:D-alanyl-lipoteichoic acid acyltransferase DltB (MBOAT superfamily)
VSFNSFGYVFLFLPIVAILHAIARRLSPNAARGTLLLASLTFYGWASPAHLPLLVLSILVNWAIARRLPSSEPAPRKRLFVLGLVLNLGFLGVYKYAGFLLRGLHTLGLPAPAAPAWAFPLGISFFTLQQVMYLVDCYEGLIPPSGLLDHATFVSFFPYVVSGPLARAKNIVRQLTAPAPAGDDGVTLVAKGLYLFSIGLFKKVIFADSFGHVADFGYASIGQWSTLETWVFSIAYTLQIYFDFSGYSDMALGSARMLGIEIPRNFNVPFRAKTVTEFWQRWHISLSAFITTYLYTPILRNFRKATPAKAAVATLIAMGIAGLWHGPALTFVVFGLLHGAGLAVNQLWKRTKRKVPAPLAWAMTFVFVNLAFVFFRSPDLATALGAVARFIPHHAPLAHTVLAGVSTLGVTTLVPPLLLGAVLAFVGKSSDELAADFQPTRYTSLATAVRLVPALVYMNSNIVQSFVYFKF